MRKISDFAKLSGVTVKTLRYYDEIGLLKPKMVDESTGYRYYSEEQLLTLKRIASFKEEGFTLEQIKDFLTEDITLDSVKSKLALKQAELKQLIQQAELQLSEIDGRLASVALIHEGPIQSRITIKQVDAQLAASIRDRIPRTQLCVLLDELIQYVRRYDADHDGSKLTMIWHSFADDDEAPIDVEVALPLIEAIPSSSRVSVGHLPGIMRAASILHQCNPYAHACNAVKELYAWAASQGYTQLNKMPYREVYITADKEIYGNTRSAELLLPIA